MTFHRYNRHCCILNMTKLVWLMWIFWYRFARLSTNWLVLTYLNRYNFTYEKEIISEILIIKRITPHPDTVSTCLSVLGYFESIFLQEKQFVQQKTLTCPILSYQCYESNRFIIVWGNDVKGLIIDLDFAVRFYL